MTHQIIGISGNIRGEDKDSQEPVRLAAVELASGIYALAVAPYVWDTGDTAYEKARQALLEAHDVHLDVDDVEAKLDDLRGALKSVDSDELISRLVNTSGTEINPAKEDGNLASVLTAVQALRTSKELDDIVTAVEALRSSSTLDTLETDLESVKTAVEKIDDLQAALKSVDTDELISRITDSSGTEINPAKEDGNLASIKIAVQDEKNDYKLSDFDCSGDPIYIGMVDKAENWIIEEINISNGTSRYHSGSGSYSTAWTNRSTHSYDPYYTEF